MPILTMWCIMSIQAVSEFHAIVVEADSLEPETKKAKVDYHFNPTEDEPWVQKTVEFGWAFSLVYTHTIRPLFSVFVRPKLSEEGWGHLERLDLDTLKSFGDIEKVSIKILKQEMTADAHRKEQIHTKLKNTLRTYAEEGFGSALPQIIELIKNP